MNKYLIIFFIMTLISCNSNDSNSSTGGTDTLKQEYAKGTFGYDLDWKNTIKIL